ncbi:MAG: hypothetical protein IIY21_04895 [Clostridiales bacterium]|jgi:hypothetical protein|nr:hypothetical protein [Clostridiales bacterium]MBQ1572179.1 hypothetical protein [Clostridiales bacterium]
MKIGKGFVRSEMNYVQVDFSRNTELTGNFMIPTKDSILRDSGKKYYVSHTPDGEGCVRLYRYDDYYVKWKGKMYHVDSPEKYDILVNIISTDFALAKL